MADDHLNPEADAQGTRAWSLAMRVVDLARGLIVTDNPFLSSSIGLLELQPQALDDPFACDGKTLFVDARQLLRDFSQTREVPVHDLAHVLVHCILLHPFVSDAVDGPSWDLAADIVAESLVVELVGAREGERGTKEKTALKQLTDDFGAPVSTERLYHALREGSYATERRQWGPLFHVDDHGLWPSSQQAGEGGGQAQQGQGKATSQNEQASPLSKMPISETGGRHEDKADDPIEHRPDTGDEEDSGAAHPERTQTAPAGSASPGLSPQERSRAEEAWNRAAKSMRVNLETISRTQGKGLGNLMRELEVGAHERVDYREFLRQFAVEHEDMRLSDDEFDYVFYTYGLELYRNMPLIEPLEYRSEKRIRDFVIVIDTSSSVSAKVVQEFVNTTFDVLTSEGGFFAKTNIHIIQADARVQSDTKITSLADLDRWRRSIKLRGFGGTDFRPAFQYVQQLRHQGEFDDLQGLVYFTDGWGIYPKRMPPYKCAFVFYDEDHRPELVPPWAIQVVLHPGAFESMSVY